MRERERAFVVQSKYSCNVSLSLIPNIYKRIVKIQEKDAVLTVFYCWNSSASKVSNASFRIRKR